MNRPEDVVRIAREYLGTPFHMDGRIKNVGIDCIGLIICIAKELGWDGPSCTKYRLLDGQRRCEVAKQELGLVDLPTIVPGCIVCIKVGHSYITHFGVVVDEDRIIHSTDRIGKVVEHNFTQAWKNRVVAIWAMPTVSY